MKKRNTKWQKLFGAIKKELVMIAWNCIEPFFAIFMGY